MSLPPYIDRKKVHGRLQVIFPEGVPHRAYCVRELAASTIFVMLYVGAVEGTEQWLAPRQVFHMSNIQSIQTNDNDRTKYATSSLARGFRPRGRTWYRENTREPIRDETIRQGLIPNNAVLERTGVPTTSEKPRYALSAEFAALFDPALSSDDLQTVAETWRKKYLSPAALARTVLLRKGAATTAQGTLVTFPNGETRRMTSGPSSEISKSVVESFSSRFLRNPAVLWLSESGAKVVARDDQLAAQIGLKISADRNLPDIILVDLGDNKEGDLLLIFVEVVATDGPITHSRKRALMKLATDAGFPETRVAFVTAFLDRSRPAFKRAVPDIAWDSFVWFAAEPNHLMILHQGKETAVKSLAQWR